MSREPAQRTAAEGAVECSAQRILQRLEMLAQCTDEPGRITRLYLSNAHRQAADLVMGWMAEAGLAPRIDPLGTVIGRYDGAANDAPVLWLGSHIDSVPDAGRFDGTLGVVMAIEAVSLLRQSGRRLPFAIAVLAFGDEEGSRFASTLSGSRLLAGRFDSKILDETDAAGITRHAALRAFGCDPDRIAQEIAGPTDRVSGYVEVHIEQGPVLEANDLPVGVVNAINGASRGTITVNGTGGHAGTVPMALRRDAVCAAAEMILAIEHRARADTDLVATVGQIETPGGAVNSVPGVARFTIDIRSPEDTVRQTAIKDLSHALGAIATRRGVELNLSIGYEAPATPCDARLSEIIADAIKSQGLVPLRLPSGAGHDAMAFRGQLPIAMMFVRCRRGVSHSPAEFTSREDIEVAIAALANFLERLAATDRATVVR